MNDLKNNFSYIKDDLALTREERALMRSELERVSMPSTNGAVLSPYLFFTGPLRFAGAFAVLVIAALGGSSAFASAALPGDALYSVKIHLNENVERTLAPSPIAKAVVDIKHAEERLSEVELLAARGDAADTDIADVAEQVASAVASATDTAHDLANSGDEAEADSIHARISSTLLAHADILDAQAGSLEDEDEDSGRSLRALSFAISATADVADASHEEDADTTDKNPAVAAEVALDREAQVQDLVKSLTDGLNDDGVPQESHDELLSELATIEADYGATRELVASEAYEDAAASYGKIGQRAYRALALLKSAKRINETTGKEVVITLENSTSSADEKEEAQAVLMKTAASFAAPALDAGAVATTEATSAIPQLRKGTSDDRTLEFRVRARSWNP